MGGSIASKQQPIVLTQQMLKNDQISKPSQLKQLPNELQEIILKLVNNEVIKIYIDCSLKCSELKLLVYKHISKTLQPENFIFKLNDKRIRQQQILVDILTLNDIIVQERLPLRETKNLKYISKIQDDFTLEKGVVPMKCGHNIGRNSINEMMRFIIKQKKELITCPHPGCTVQWNFNQCVQVGCFTKEEKQLFWTSLRRNWMQKNSRQCPGCKNPAIFQNKDARKIVCLNKKCSFKAFCKYCNNKWLEKSDKMCGNVACNFSEFYNETKTKPFTFFDTSKGKHFTIYAPTHRLCPECKAPIEHGDGCKHMVCYNCKVSFCFVCLSVQQKGWKCGQFNQFCGKVAERQSVL